MLALLLVFLELCVNYIGKSDVYLKELLDFVKALFQLPSRLCEVFHVSSNELARSIDTVSSTLILVSVKHFIHVFLI